MSLTLLQIILSIIGILIAAVGIPLLYFQLRGVQRSLRSATHAAIYNQAADFRAHLIQYPHLRKYFFESAKITPAHEDYNRVLTLAEIYLNYLEHIAVLGDDFGSENRPSLERFTKTALERSPILRQHLAENRRYYSDALSRFIED